jgi:hypothetical protein
VQKIGIKLRSDIQGVQKYIRLEAFIKGIMMEAEMASETLGFCPQLTRLVARKDFIVFRNIFCRGW